MSGEDDTDCILWLVLDKISSVMWLIYWSHRRGGHSWNFLTRVTYRSQLNSKLNVQENDYIPNPTVEHVQISVLLKFVVKGLIENESKFVS